MLLQPFSFPLIRFALAVKVNTVRTPTFASHLRLSPWVSVLSLFTSHISASSWHPNDLLLYTLVWYGLKPLLMWLPSNTTTICFRATSLDNQGVPAVSCNCRSYSLIICSRWSFSTVEERQWHDWMPGSCCYWGAQGLVWTHQSMQQPPRDAGSPLPASTGPSWRVRRVWRLKSKGLRLWNEVVRNCYLPSFHNMRGPAEADTGIPAPLEAAAHFFECDARVLASPFAPQ